MPAKGLTLIGDLEEERTSGELSNAYVLLVEEDSQCWTKEDYLRADALEISLGTHFGTFPIAVLSHLLYDSVEPAPTAYEAMAWVYLEDKTLKALNEAGMSARYCAKWLRNQRGG